MRILDAHFFFNSCPFSLFLPAKKIEQTVFFLIYNGKQILFLDLFLEVYMLRK